jgi:ankyrin repeat protein
VKTPIGRTPGATPLFIAAQCGHARVVERLLAAGAEPDRERKGGATALSIAAQVPHDARHSCPVYRRERSC